MRRSGGSASSAHGPVRQVHPRRGRVQRFIHRGHRGGATELVKHVTSPKKPTRRQLQSSQLGLLTSRRGAPRGPVKHQVHSNVPAGVPQAGLCNILTHRHRSHTSLPHARLQGGVECGRVSCS